MSYTLNRDVEYIIKYTADFVMTISELETNFWYINSKVFKTTYMVHLHYCCCNAGPLYLTNKQKII